MLRITWSSWRRVLGEGLLIVASVYLAIFLEGWSQDRDRVKDARSGLLQLRADLLADRADLQNILTEQRAHSLQYKNLLRWLDSPGAMPYDSVDTALEQLGTSNRTMFPRRGAWTSLISTGLLSSIGDQSLVTRLGGFYENINGRLEYNGRDYDYNLNEVFRVTVPSSWDRGRRRLVGDVLVLRNQLEWIERGWTQWYLDLLAEYENELNALLKELDTHLNLPAGA